MYARVSHTRYPAENRDAGVRIVAEEYLPAVQRARGFRGYHLLDDGKPGTGLAIVFWESEEDADAVATDAAVAAANTKLAALGMEIESRKMYEVVVQG